MATVIQWAQGEISVDAMVTAQHARAAQVTQHPVEVGSNVTDHIRPVPRVLNMSGWLGTQSFDPDLPIVDGQTQWNQLQTLLTTGELLTVVTRLQTYRNLVLTSISAPQTAQAGRALQFSAAFQEVRFVETAEIQVNIPTKRPRQKKKRDDGARPTDPTTGPGREKTAFASLLESGANLAVGR